MSDAFNHGLHREAPVEAEAITSQVTPGVLVGIEALEGAAEAGFQVAQQGIDPVKLG